MLNRENVKNSYNIIIMLIAICFINATIICSVDEVASVVISFVIWCIYIYAIATRCNKYIFLALPFVFSYSSAIIAELYFELNNLYIIEINEITRVTGGLSRLVLYDVVFLSSSYWIYNKIVDDKTDLVLKIRRKKVIWSIFLLLSIALIIGLWIYGSPVLNGQDRYAYWFLDVQDPLIKAIHSNYAIAILLLAFLFDERKKLVVLCIIIAAIITMLGGEKFTQFINWIFYFVMVYFVRHEAVLSSKNKAKMFFMFFVVIIILVGVISYHYTELSGSNDALEDMFIMRFASQGQIWWGVDKLITDLDNNVDVFFQEMHYWFDFKLDEDIIYNFGMYKVMSVISTQERVLRYLDLGIRFTLGWPGVGLYYFGYFGLIFAQLIFGSLLGWWCAITYKIIKKADIIKILILIEIYRYLVEAFVMGNMYVLFSIKGLAFVFSYIAVDKFKMDRGIAKV